MQKTLLALAFIALIGCTADAPTPMLLAAITPTRADSTTTASVTVFALSIIPQPFIDFTKMTTAMLGVK